MKITIKNVEKIVNNFPTKHKIGFTGGEIIELMIKYNIDLNVFLDKLGVNTVSVIGGESITYHHDIIKGLRCVIENREQTLEEWD